MAKPRPETNPPKSEITPQKWGDFVRRMLAQAQLVPQDVEAAVGELLEILVEVEPGCAVGVRLQQSDGSEELIDRRSALSVEPRDSGVPPHGTSGARDIGRMFSDLPLELQVPLPAPLSGSLHFAAQRFLAASPESYGVLLEQAANIIGLTVRALGSRSSHAEPASSNLAQLEKLASIGQTASQIVHELNNPLTAIIAYSDYLTRRMRDSSMPEGDVDRLMKINEAAVRIQRFCRELTDYSRPSGSLQTPVDVREILDRALTFCVHGLRGANITVERVYRDVPAIEGVDTALTQVFVNLITNAWHAMPSGGTLSLRARQGDDRVVVEIADEGHGIPEGDLPRIFDAYFTTKSKGSGVGLGLSIVKQIVSDHRGNIRAEPREPSGTVFVLSFPRFES